MFMWKKGDICGYCEEKGKDEFYGIFDHYESAHLLNPVFSMSVLVCGDENHLAVGKNETHNYWGIYKMSKPEQISRFYELMKKAGYEEIDGKWALIPNFDVIKNKFEHNRFISSIEIKYLIDHFKN